MSWCSRSAIPCARATECSPHDPCGYPQPLQLREDCVLCLLGLSSADGANGLNFAIPVDMIKARCVKQAKLRRGHHVHRHTDLSQRLAWPESGHMPTACCLARGLVCLPSLRVASPDCRHECRFEDDESVSPWHFVPCMFAELCL